ncbi:RuvC-like Holliday junction resolvase [Gordonia phage MelBins]|uniref:RuvC-like resolvase n=1 Tax=Gordonia phage MelBins TaxID=2656540 RepID=A0A649VN15_9CAUD|nr:RuvC-like Holliday junction resolvase [Gordonia phage MelBins]QGJ93621.1 RuvC-like resolvase [Gordonia phage MelBins]
MTLRILGVDPSLTSAGLAKLTIDNTTVLGDGLSDDAHARLCQVQTTSVHSSPNLKDQQTGVALPNQMRLRVQRIVAVRRQILRASQDCDLVVIEELFASNKSTQASLMDRSHLAGSICEHLYAAGTPCIVVHNKRVKKFATDNGNADKTAVAVGMSKLWGDRVTPHGDDEFDALALATMGGIRLARHRLPIRVLEHHLHVVAGIDWTDYEDKITW